MFTGIVETTARIESVTRQGSGVMFWISSPFWEQLRVDQSVSHDGACLTVEEISDGKHRVTAVAETLAKTSLGSWRTGRLINLERSMQLNGRLDGHLVQGHVDTTGNCVSVINRDGSWEYRFSFASKYAHLVIEKGSICVNGVSLTAFDVSPDAFTVAIIPYTFQHTNLREIQEGDAVNLEFDMIGKYVQRHLDVSRSS